MLAGFVLLGFTLALCIIMHNVLRAFAPVRAGAEAHKWRALRGFLAVALTFGAVGVMIAPALPGYSTAWFIVGLFAVLGCASAYDDVLVLRHHARINAMIAEFADSNGLNPETTSWLRDRVYATSGADAMKEQMLEARARQARSNAT